MPYFTAGDIPDPADLRQTSFELCVSLNNVEGMKSLFAQGINMEANCAEYGDGNALVLAAEAGASEAVSYLLSIGVSHDPASIGAAAVRGYVEIVETLLRAGIKPNSDSIIGVESVQMIERLVSSGAPLNQPSTWSALTNAVVNDKIQIVEVLLRSGADPNVASTDDWTPLMQAARGGDLAILRALLQYGANKALRNSDDETAIDIARTSNWLEAVDLLK